MSLRVRCPHCSSVLTLEPEQVGSTITCTDCGELFQTRAPQQGGPTPHRAEEALQQRPVPPRTRSRPPALDDEEEIPIAQLAKRSPRRKVPPSTRPVGLILGGCLAAALLMILGVSVVGFLAYRWLTITPPVNLAGNNAGAQPGGGGANAVAPEPGEEPGAAPRPPATDIKVAPLTAEKATVSLPASIADACVGGGGRYLIFHLPSQRKLAVFDVNEAKVVKYLAVAEDRVLFAAGQEKLLVVLPDKGVIQRYDLAKLEREATAPLAIEGRIFTAVMGSASRGPLVLGGPELRGAGPLRFLDPLTFKEKVYAGEGGRMSVGTHPQYPHVMRVSADGQVIGMWNIGLSPSGLQTVILSGDNYRGLYEHETVGSILPSPDGRILYTGAGLYTAELRKVGGGGNNERVAWGNAMVPAVHGNSYLSLRGSDDFGQRGSKPYRVSVHLQGETRPLLTLGEVEGLTQRDIFDRNGPTLPLDRRVFLIPQAKLLVTIGDTADKLYLRRFDLHEALEKSGIDYLLVTTQPPTTYSAGKVLSYQLEVKSKKGGVKYKLDSGPEGMTVSPKGRMTWKVPANFQQQADVIITVSDASGQEVFHSFKLQPARVAALEPLKKDNLDPKDKFVKKDDLPPFRKEKDGFGRILKDDMPPPPPPLPPDEPKFPPRMKDKEPRKGMEPPLMKDNEPKEKRALATLRPVVPLELKPAPLKADEVVLALPSAAGEVCLGGGGRFLILHLPRERKLAIFDANEAKVVKYLPVAEDDIKFAAGMDKLIVALPSSGVFQRWSLTTFQREASVPSPLSKTILAIAMGHASNGPLAVQAGEDERFFDQTPVALLDPQTFKAAFEAKIETFEGIDHRAGTGLHVAGDGSVIALPNGGSFVLRGRSYHFEPKASGLPSADGRMVFGFWRLTTVGGKPIGEPTNREKYYLPAAQAPYYLSLNLTKDLFSNKTTPQSPRIFVAGDARPLLTLATWSGMEGYAGEPHRELRVMLHKHVFLVPRANLVVVLPYLRDTLILHRLEVEKRIENAAIDYLYVRSTPPVAVKGQPFRYDIDVRSKKGSVKLKLDSGPDGMKFDGNVLNWAVPKDHAVTEVDVLVSISDASEQEIYHSIRLPISDPSPAALQPQKEGVATPNKTIAVKPPTEPATAGNGIVVAPLKKDKETVSLPSPTSGLCVGGGGRYLILHLPKERKLAVFDVNEVKIVKELQLAEEEVRLAAGLEDLIIVLPGAGVLQRWSLKTLTKEATLSSPLKKKVETVALGSASRGPLLLGGGDRSDSEVLLVDPRTMKPLDITLTGAFGMGTLMRVSASGTVFTRHNLFEFSREQTVYSLQGKKVTSWQMPDKLGYTTPSPDGHFIYTPRGIYTSEGKHLGKKRYGKTEWTMPLPSVEGTTYYVSVDELSESYELSLHLVGGEEPIATLTDVEVPEVTRQGEASLPLDKMVTFIPSAKLLVVLSKERDQLDLYRVDPGALLAKLDRDYLVLTSAPVTAAAKGAKYRYPVCVRSKKGQIEMKLDSAPDGMKITPAGVLEWDVPKDHAAGEVDVLLCVNDGSGKEAFQSFRVRVVDKVD